MIIDKYTMNIVSYMIKCTVYYVEPNFSMRWQHIALKYIYAKTECCKNVQLYSDLMHCQSGSRK